MKSRYQSIVFLLIVLAVCAFGTFNSSAAARCQVDSLLYDDGDEEEAFEFQILEPSVAPSAPNSLKRRERAGNDADEAHAALLQSLAARPMRVAAVQTSDEDYSVGQIPIEAGVSPSGGRVYSIPVPVAAGWKAVPHISLCYNSQAGNGSAGYGWEIGGLSSIEIRNRNYYYDGTYRHSDYDSGDAVYSLDGVPVVSGPHDMGEFTYATARGNLRIKKNLTSSGVLSYFTVLYPDGSKGTFGFEDNTAWRTSYPLTKLEDINGNVITFEYYFLGNHYDITAISYGDDARISFSYEYRSDQGHVRYRAGQQFSYPGRRLASIVSSDGDSEICRYSLTYDEQDGVSLLREVGCSSDGASYRPLTFTYGIDSQPATAESFSLADQNFFTKYFTKTSDVDILYKRGKFLPGGFNDGIVMLPKYKNYDVVATKKYKLKKYNKYGSKYSKDQLILCNLSACEYPFQFELRAGEGFQTIEAVDVDGDGVDEIVKINNSCSEQYITDFKIHIYSFDRYGAASCDSLSFRINDGTINPCFNNPAHCDYFFGNFRGTGRQMLLITTRSRSKFVLVDLASKSKVSENSLITMSDEVAGLLLTTDFENDGQDDLCHITDTGMDVYSLTPLSGTGFSKRKTYTGVSKSLLYREPSSTVNGIPKEYPGELYLLDINGDGYNDIACTPGFRIKDEGYQLSSKTWNISVFNGKSFSTRSQEIYPRVDDDKIIFMDVDCDGLPDMLHWQKSHLFLIKNVNGNFPKESVYTQVATEENADIVPCDISAFGLQGDILTVAGPYVNVYKFNIDHSANRLLTQFEDSFGVEHYNIYGKLSQEDGAYFTDYDRCYDAASGFMRRRVPLTVLHEANSVSGGTYVSDEYYTYYDAVFNTRGLGFCGFGKTCCRDYVGGFVTTTENSPEKMGLPVRVSRALRSSDSSPFEVTANTYDNHSTAYGKLSPRLTKSETTDNVTGVTTTTDVTYDDYDYPTQTKITRVAGDGVKQTEKSENTYEHNVLLDRYVLGVVKESTVSRNNGHNVSTLWWAEKSVMTYDDRCRPLTKKDYVGQSGFTTLHVRPVPPDTTSIHQIINYYPDKLTGETRWTYDSRGNVISEKSAPYGATTFTGSTYTYDDAGRYLVSSTDALGRTSSYSGYNKFGRPTSVTDFRGRETEYVYDEWGGLTKAVHPDGTIEETLADWGGEGLYKVTSKSSGSPTTVVHYDALRRTIRTENLRFNGQWQRVDRVYDSRGRLKKESLPFRGSAATLWNEISYDDYSRKTGVTESSGKWMSWSYSGTSVTSFENGIRCTRKYDAAGNLESATDAGGTVTYSLRDDGQPSKVTVTGGLTTKFEYDEYGRRTKMADPSAGTLTDAVVYNADGSSASTHTNPNGSVVTYIDRYGRTTRVERPGEYNTDYVYDSYGLLTSEVSSNGTSKVYTYDSLDRVLTVKETVPDGKWLKKTFTYGTGSNVSSIAYESQNGPITTESYLYANGTNYYVGLPGVPVRRLESENDFGQPTSVTTGGIGRTYSYNVYGMPTGRTMGSVMDCSYSFNAVTGNLLDRTDNLRDRTEQFFYDALNRLTGIDDRHIGYYANGNVYMLNGVGTMSYDNSSKPHQLTSLTMENEDVVPSRVQNISYTCYSRPSIMAEGGRSAAFTYNGDGDRVKMNVAEGASSVLVRYYIGKQYEMDVKPSGTTERLYLGGDAYSAPMVYIREGGGSWTLYNIGRDYLGNITHIATSNGTLVEENSYDPWGRLRNPSTQEIYSTGSEPELMLGRGFTGHEHLTWFGLINMNARLYDPVVGRFLSPDPYVQMPDFTQNFNRYSYCLNNPLVYVDESGEVFFTTTVIVSICVAAVVGTAVGAYQGNKIAENKGLEGSAKVWTIIGGGVIGSIAGTASGFAGAGVGVGMAAAGVGGFAAGAATGAAAGAAGGFINGFGMTVLETGDVVNGLEQGALQAGLGCLSGAIVGGVVQGTISAAQGNSFWDGSAPMSNVSQGDPLVRPQRKGYHPSLDMKKDLYHNFPYSLDDTIINEGIPSQRISDKSFFFEFKGSINGVDGVYQIGINEKGIIFHRHFLPFKH